MLENISSYLKNEDYRVSILKDKIHVLNYKSIVDINEKEAIIKIENKLFRIKGEYSSFIKFELKFFKLLLGVRFSCCKK